MTPYNKATQEIDQLFSRARGALSWVKFAGRVPKHETLYVMEKFIQTEWKEGRLPIRIGFKAWVVGLKTYHSFFGTTFVLIIVGPAKPSSVRKNSSAFRRYWSQVKVEAGFG